MIHTASCQFYRPISSQLPSVPLYEVQTLSVLTAIFQVDLAKPVLKYSILDFIGAKDDGGGDDNWSCKMCKAPVKSAPDITLHYKTL